MTIFSRNIGEFETLRDIYMIDFNEVLLDFFINSQNFLNDL